MDLHSIQPVEFVRSRIQMYFHGHLPNEFQLAERIVGDILYLGGDRILIRRVEHWIIISSDFDWMHSYANAIGQLFETLAPLPEAGPNAVRSEILTAATCKNVVVCKDGRRIQIVGSISDEDNIWNQLDKLCKSHRTLAFIFGATGPSLE